MKRKLTRIQIRKLLLREMNSLMIQEQANTTEEDNKVLVGKIVSIISSDPEGPMTQVLTNMLLEKLKEVDTLYKDLMQLVDDESVNSTNKAKTLLQLLGLPSL